MLSKNLVILIGNLTADAEVTAFPSGLHAYSLLKESWRVLRDASKKETWEKEGEPRSQRVVVAYRLDLGSSPSGSPEVSAQGADAPF